MRIWVHSEILSQNTKRGEGVRGREREGEKEGGKERERERERDLRLWLY